MENIYIILALTILPADAGKNYMTQKVHGTQQILSPSCDNEISLLQGIIRINLSLDIISHFKSIFDKI